RAEPLLHAIRDFARAEDLPRLTGLLEKLGGREEQEMLLRAIGSAAGPEGGRTLLGYLESAPEGVRREAVVEALADLAKKEELPALIPALTRLLEAETQGRAQWQLARAIASHGPEGVAAVGEILARDPDPRRRGEVLRGLESVHPEEAAALARGFLLDPSPELRGRALKVLASSGDPAAPDALRAALEVETEPGLREAIAVLLKHREGR
ncbi:MAG: HEAT repeat domain-containing protein, partial [Planctomycetes bacterium]|nr:HEAT repeat domain-containing protein [Planctomycetota bacterium]